MNDLDEYTPFHISRFFPQYKSTEYNFVKPTELKLLYNGFDIAKEVGLKYIYVGNVINKKYSQTECPQCSEVVVRRNNVFGIEEMHLDKDGKCENCGFKICVIS